MDEEPQWRRVLRLAVAPMLIGGLIGIGLVVLLGYYAIFVAVLAGIPWSIREIRWSRRMQREIAADYERLMTLGRPPQPPPS